MAEVSQVQICNRALQGILGVERINSLDDSTAAAEQCKLHYDDILRGLLEMHPWNFATQRVTLSKFSTNDREDEWAYKYSRPVNALRIRWVNEPCAARIYISQGRSPDSERELTSDAIYSDVDGAICEYTGLIEDPKLYPQSFADLMTAEIAKNVCMGLVRDSRLATETAKLAERALDHALVQDNQSTPPEVVARPLSLQVRGLQGSWDEGR